MSGSDLTEEQKKEKFLLDALKGKYARLFLTKEEMLTYEEDYLMSLYLNKLGALQHESFCLKTEISILRKKMELLQGYFARNIRPNHLSIDSKIELQFIEHRKIIQDHSEQLANAREYHKKSLLSRKEVIQFRALYSFVIRRLHPDLVPGLPDFERKLFFQAKAAYNLCNLTLLRQIVNYLNFNKEHIASLSPETGSAQIDTLKEGIFKLRAQIKQLNERFPFNYRERLKDEEWIRMTKLEMLLELQALREEREKCQTHLQLFAAWEYGAN